MWKLFGIRMGDNFINTLTEPVDYKDYITNESALESGVRTVYDGRRYKSRELTLTFTIEGADQEEYNRNRKMFFLMLHQNNGRIFLTLPSEYQINDPNVEDLQDDNAYPPAYTLNGKKYGSVYRLEYMGKGAEYGRSLQRNFGKMSLKFREPNPGHRSRALFSEVRNFGFASNEGVVISEE